MSQHKQCCILELCCGRLQQHAALSHAIAEEGGIDAAAADKVATWLTEHFDFAPAGSLGAFKSEVVRLAKERAARTAE